MRHLAFVFPGQGSQQLGMLADYAEQYPIVEQVFAEASAAINKDLWQIVQNGPDTELNRTEYTQPILLAASYAIWQIYQQQQLPQPEILAGHSLGEYTALVCAGSLSFTDAIVLVNKRGQYMQEAVPAGVGAMAAVLGLAPEQINEVCEQIHREDYVVQAVNYNSPLQTVIAGEKAAVEEASAALKAAGAGRVIPLPVSVPSHCNLMRSAAEKLALDLAAIDFKAPQIPVIHNVDVTSHDDCMAIRWALTQQLFQPVQWVQTIEAIAATGVDLCFECGPGKVLTGLNKKTTKDFVTASLGDCDLLAKASTMLAA